VLGFRRFLFFNKTWRGGFQGTFHREQEIQGNIKMPVPAGLNEDTDAAVEPRGGPPLFLAGSITRTNEESQKTNPKVF